MSSEEYKKHMEPLLADGYTLDPPDFERLRLWTFVLYQLSFASIELATLIGMKVELFDKTNFYETFSRFYAIIVTYGRCFTNSGKGISTLNAKDVFAARPDLRKKHDRMMEIRNQVVAHTEHHELVRVTMAVKEEADRILIKHVVTPSMPGNELEGFLETSDYAGKYVTVQLNKMINHLEKKMGKTIIHGD